MKSVLNYVHIRYYMGRQFMSEKAPRIPGVAIQQSTHEFDEWNSGILPEPNIYIIPYLAC